MPSTPVKPYNYFCAPSYLQKKSLQKNIDRASTPEMARKAINDQYVDFCDVHKLRLSDKQVDKFYRERIQTLYPQNKTRKAFVTYPGNDSDGNGIPS